MRRALLAIATLLTISASPTFAGYIIIRVLLEGGDTGDNELFPGSPGSPPGLPSTASSPFGPPGPGKMRPGGRQPMPSFGPGMPGPMGMPGTPGAPGQHHREIDHTHAVVVLIPLEADLVSRTLDSKRPFDAENNPTYRKFSLPYYGQRLQAALFVDSSTIQLYTDLLDKPGPKKTRGTEMRQKHYQWTQKKDNPRLLYDAMILAIESGFIRDLSAARTGTPRMDAITFAQELLDVAAEKKLTLTPEVEQFVKAWGQMSKAVTTPATQPSNAEDWKSLLDATNVRVDGHYALIYWDSTESEVTRRSVQLNDNFTAFYLWYATRGVVLPVPDKPLVAVIAKQGPAMRPLHVALDGLPMQSDAFYSAAHNLLVLSPERLDGTGQTFLRQTQQVFVKGLTRDRLLAGEIPKLDHTGEKGSKPEDVARANTLAVVEKLVVEESEVAAVSREGTRQLLFASGVLPKHVTLPNWLTQGALNFFTRPRGPAYITKGDHQAFMTVAFTTGYGVPNYVLQSYYHDLERNKELNPNPVRLLQLILSDAYFAGIKDGQDPDPTPPRKKKKHANPNTPPGTGPGPMPGTLPGPGPMPLLPGPGGMVPGMGPGAQPESDDEDPIALLREKRQRLTIKAQATSWALYYYLANARPNELKQYIAELNKLPRDLPIDGQTAYNTFVRVFGLAATGSTLPDPDRMKRFAKDWLDYVSIVPRTSIDIPLIVPEPKKVDPKNPMFPMPGTFPMPGNRGPRPGGN